MSPADWAVAAAVNTDPRRSDAQARRAEGINRMAQHIIIRPRAVWHSPLEGSNESRMCSGPGLLFLGGFCGLRRFALFGFGFGTGRWFGIFFFVVLHDVLDDERDAAVGWVEGGVRLAQTLVGKSADLGHLVGPDSVGLHDAAGGVRAIGRKFPVAVGGGGIRLRIGVTFDGEFVGEFA